jgi:Tol biopolymer transport system component
MLLHYRLVDKIGEGGMGVVWKALDTSLDREVAIKVLPEGLVTPDRLARFEREAKLLASLDHPAIAAVHGLHEASGVRFLAMELVPGEDLAHRLTRGPLPVEDVIAIGQQIAAGLEAAHESGVVHRDLKPSNVVLRPDGRVKVLDFGLAKALAPDTASGSNPSLSPTVTSAGTLAGVILGTAAYMSPEQARGRSVDRRADIWAFGCVLYEMLTARRLFSGETVSDTLAAVLRAEIDLKELPPATPDRLRRLLARCLDRDPSMRLRDAGEARIALGAKEPEPVATPTKPRRTTLAWALGGLLLLVAGFLGTLLFKPAPSPTPRLAFEIALPGEHLETGSIALSPDGTKLALVVRDKDGVTELRVRSLDSFDIRPIRGTRGASHPFWSPSGKEIGYFASGQLLRVAIDGTAPQRIAPAPRAAGGTWGADDVILFGTSMGPIHRTSARGGGTPVAITKPEDGVEDAHVWPAFLPDGRRFVFLADASTEEGHHICLGTLDGKPPKILRKGFRSAPFVDPAGALLLVKRFQLLAYPFDFDRETLSEDSSLVVDGIYPFGQHHDTAVTLGANGVLAHQAGSAASTLVRLDLDRGGKTQLLPPDRYGNPALSPDGRQVAFDLDGSTDERLVWVHDVERGVRTPISPRGALADSPAWSADGSTVYFDSNPDGVWKVYRKSASGGGEPESLDRPTTKGDVGVLDLSEDGRWLLVNTSSETDSYDLYMKSLDKGDAPWIPWTSGPSSEPQAKFSPDSRWVAYVSDGSGRSEIYVAPTVGGPAVRRWQISSSGGLEAEWSKDGSQIYYRAPNDELLRVPIHASADGISAGAPTVVLALDLPPQNFVRNTFVMMPDGSVLATDSQAETRIRVQTSWR